MKKILLSTVFLFTVGFVANAQTTAPENQNQAEIQFEEDQHDFGTIKEGTMATYEFKFKNIGKEPLILTNVQASCGCTTPQWPKEPIAPGKTGIITATYNSHNRPGQFNKAITVTSNAKTISKVITIRGYVEQPPAAPAVPQSPVVQPSNSNSKPAQPNSPSKP
jgi:archaellum component FlaG (FlaF/FlaG flagellin family)